MKQYLNPCYWFEGGAKYIVENRLNPSLKNKLKIAGNTLALFGVCIAGVGIPVFYLTAKTGDFSESARRLEKHLLDKGYTSQQISSVLQ